MKPNRTIHCTARQVLISVACVAAAAWCLPAAAQVASRVASSKVNRVALNPQPLPPKALATPTAGLSKPTMGQDRGIIIVSGKPGGAVSLNPQPLPPKAVQQRVVAGHDAAAQRGIIIVGGKTAGRGAR